MYQESDGKVFIEDTDQCRTCMYRCSPTKLCLFLHALLSGVTSLNGNFVVNQCWMYKRTFEIVKDTDG